MIPKQLLENQLRTLDGAYTRSCNGSVIWGQRGQG